jgi:hypothetical protein
MWRSRFASFLFFEGRSRARVCLRIGQTRTGWRVYCREAQNKAGKKLCITQVIGRILDADQIRPLRKNGVGRVELWKDCERGFSWISVLKMETSKKH